MAMKGSDKSSRRNFLKRAAVVAGAAFGAPYIIPASAMGADGATAPSNRIIMGACGIGNQGSGDLGNFLGFNEVQMVAISDVKKEAADRGKSAVDGRNKNKDCKVYPDFLEMFERPDIEAVMMAVPDHWHGLMAITACKMGKDVYCEKPLSLTVKEGREMVNAARRYGRVVSSGSQRVWDDYGNLARIVQSGMIGDVKEAWVDTGAPSGPCFLPEKPVPPGFDYERWLGPAPWAPYNEGRVSGAYGGVGWRIFEDYSGGQTTDWGAHKFGGAVFALQVDRTSPVEVIVEGKGATLIYANGTRIHHKQGRDMTYKGSAGEVNHGNQGAFKTDYFIPNYKGGKRSIYGDFVHCVRSRERCFQDFEVAHRTATVCHLSNLCYRFGRGFKFDPVKEEVVGDPEINRWMDRPKRTPWRR